MAWIATTPIPGEPRPGARGAPLLDLMAGVPGAAEHVRALLAALEAPDLPLSMREREMIKVVVSAVNRCFY